MELFGVAPIGFDDWSDIGNPDFKDYSEFT